MKKLHRSFYLSSVIVLFVLFWPILYFFGRNSIKYYNQIVRVRRILAICSSAIAGISYKIKYDQNIDWSKNYILVANHTSNLDITAMMKVCPANFSFIGKDELLDNPVTGYFFRRIDIPVKRSSKISSFRAFKRAQEYLLAGKSLAIFPEGGISDEYPPRLQDFKNGGFKLAVDLNIPVIPVIIEDAWKIHWDDGKKYGSKPGMVNIRVLAPVSPTGLSADELRDQIFGLFNRQLNDYNS